ncbi:MAG: Calx-beta domain-containing protein [Pyrinomonadaceae bacterium]
MHRDRIFALLLCGATLFCFTWLRRSHAQSTGLRRITNTTEEGINLNPSISGDGRVIAFESSEDVAAAGGSDRFRAIRASVAGDPAALFQMGASRAVAPAISQDGSRIAFASKDDPLGTNADGNSEIFLFDDAKLIQVTNTSPGSLANRITNGNFQPSISDDGRYIAFSSNRDLSGQNSDGNLEIFVYETSAGAFTQLTNSTSIVGFSDAKISGDGSTVAYIQDRATSPGTVRDLVKQPRVGPGPATLLVANVQSLVMTYGRAISDDGTRIVYSAETATNTTQVFLADGRVGGGVRQITSLGPRASEVPLHPTISGDGMRIAFAARRVVGGGGSNSDGGVELYIYDLPTASFSKITNGPGNATADVVSSLDDDGSLVVFNYPRILSAGVPSSDTANNSEIYVTAPPARPASAALKAVLNDASFGHEPSATKAVAPNSLAFAEGSNLANTTMQSQVSADGTFPTKLGGTGVSVNGRAAQILFVSPAQVNFLVPAESEIGTAEILVTNSENFPARATVITMNAAPGIFTRTGDGIGEGLILNADSLQEGPFDPTGGNLRLTIFATGARKGAQTNIALKGRIVNAEAVIASTAMAGLDEVHFRVPADLRGTGVVNLSVISDGRESNPVTVNFLGNPSRAIFINEVLADPPDGIAGDANHDGVRDGTQDEFVELVNGNAGETIGISGWTIKTRANGSTTETTRFTFPAGTTLPGGEAIVLFGGGNFNPRDPVFGCAQVFKAASASSGLSLTNSGLTILVRDSAGNLITQFSYGGTTALDGNSSQSLTRSPDITGSFVLHATTPAAKGRHFSPGLRVDGTPFGNCAGHLQGLSISPASMTITAGQNTQFTAHAVDEFDRTMIGIPINFASNNTIVATVDSTNLNPSTGIATATVMGRNQGTTQIQATATSRGLTLNSSLATLNVIPAVSRIDVSPATGATNRGNAHAFSATAFDQNNQPLTDVTFAWNSSNTNIATIDFSGVARGAGVGRVTITASTPDGFGGIAAGTATLDVQVPLVINEINADVGPDNLATMAIEGDANRDGLRDPDDDEFVELLNNSSNFVDLSGVIIADAASNRFTFPANTTLAGGRAVVIFGGGHPPPNDPAFGGALIFTTSSLSLNDSGDTVNVKLPIGGSDVILAAQVYGGPSGVPASSNQSLTRSADAEIGQGGGSFVTHNAATNAAGRTFSPGTRADGTPFGSPPVKRIEILPKTARANPGATQSFDAHAFNTSGGLESEIKNVSFIWDLSDPSKASLAPITGQTATATTLASGEATLRARAGAEQNTSRLSVNPALSVNDISQSEGNSGTTTFTFIVSLSNPAPADGVTFDIATRDGTATAADNDYVARALTAQTIPAGSQTYSFAVTVNGDTTIEASENFFVNIANVSGATIAAGQGQATIINDDNAALSIADVTRNEGDSSTTTFTFTVASSLPAPPDGVSFDIMTQDGTAVSPNDYVAKSMVNQVIPAGQQTYSFDVTVNGDALVEPPETFLVKITSANGNAQATGTIVNDDTANLVISQVYGGGNNAGAQFRNDFVEIFNRGTTTLDFSITPYSLQYASVGSNFGSNKTNLTSGTIGPHRYFLVQEAGGMTSGAPLPAPDATGTIGLASTFGKVALVTGTTSLSSAACPGDDGTSPFNPLNPAVADFVGYGDATNTGGHCYEGTAPAFALSNTTADFRKEGGCVDTNDNANDFFVAQPDPRNSASLIGDCKSEITINDVTLSEGNTGTLSATFTVSLSTVSAHTTTVDFATSDASATAPADYQAKNGTLTFNPGETTKPITVLVNGDTLDEPNETFVVNLSNAVNGVIIDNQGQATINDNDPAPSLSVNDASVAEGNSGMTSLTFIVMLSTASGQTVTVSYATADNTATSPSDYQPASGTLTFNPGDTTKAVTVLVNGDSDVEQSETFFINLTTPSNAVISDNQGQGTILNDDSAVISITPSVSVSEGNSGTTNATFIVTLSPASTQTVTVDYLTADGSAKSTSDYQSTSGTLTFNPGDSSKTIDVPVNGDLLVEPDESFTLSLANASANASISSTNGAGTGAITNDDVPLLVISQIYGGGGNTSSPLAVYKNDFIEIFNPGTSTVNLSGWSVQYSSASGTNTWSVTQLCPSGTCLLSPGRYFLIQEAQGTGGSTNLPAPDATGTIAMATTSGKVALVANTTALSGACPSSANILDRVGYGGSAATNDFCFEGSGPGAAPSNSNAIFRKSNGCIDTDDNANDFASGTANPRNSTFAINDCHAPPLLMINDVLAPEGNSLSKSFTFTVSLSKPALAGGVTFDIATSDGTATAGSDYVARNLSSQTISPDQQTCTFDVTVNGDAAVESDETFFVNVTNVTGATVSDGQGLGTIQNDDTPSLSIGDVTQNEGNTGTSIFSFTVTLNPASNQTVTVQYATADGTATAGSDYTGVLSTPLTFLPGETIKTVGVTVSGDSKIEPDETFFVNLSGAANALISDSQGTGTVTNDDGANVVISQIYGAGSNSGATYNADYVELLNRTSTAINITTWSIQYQSATTITGASWSLAALCQSGTCTIPANSYFLVRLTTPGGTGAALPPPDSIPGNTINLAATAGKVALVSNVNALTGTPGSGCPSSFANIIDLVGYGTGGSGANCFEGSGAGPTVGAALATFRKSSSSSGTNGCFDSNNNSTDFLSAAPSPRNSGSPANACP